MTRISVQSLNKDFRIYERPQDRLAELIFRKPRHTLYHVLSDISFALPDAKSLGIIGDNGAGKSTLLKLLVGTLQPTSGDITIHGQVAALLELGAGFHPEFTGRKNIYLNASLLGVPDENIAQLEKDIIHFSELDYFIDRPVKTYSSGMFVRLAFSIATMVRPDILIIDEALSVGDMAFQKKCVQRMNEFREQQKTMVLCSHSMFHIQELCDIAIWIHKGKIREMGECDKVVGHYEDFCNNKKTYNSIRDDIPVELQKSEKENEEAQVQDCRINSLSVKSTSGEELTTLKPLDDVVLEMEVQALVDGMEGNFGFAFMRSSEEPIASFLTTNAKDVKLKTYNKGDVFKVSLTIESVSMRIGEFYVLGGLADKSGLLWYETKFSKLLAMEANKGVGPMIMKSHWQLGEAD
ncbi:MAG: ATP-binding cassette domain-containing protein [Gammaproteobacteria bacterium]|nr:ATP-binding cassette domain-containing protein [Gammaproteobacteria bacterium]MBT3861125.1 ATP-binding cassette domain-containing protein [Gammaproteobacteria bacterium]MBT3987665.1 ATP-binding cassette domain-containing protein [Gammaproteobacteria bacterium]MBT4255211.1 ATP-binding cassette domain-containing protein [Gammaproteobacteria bacterium]MBT4581246.1 ATP-binding cassette domain-containing protein [Gammaproteobacteria bacterium]